MILAVDTGNTSTHFALFRDGVVLEHGINANDNFSDLKSFIANKSPGRGILCSVRHIPVELDNCLVNINMLHLSHDTPVPVQVEYKERERLGLDRLAAAVGARVLFPGKSALIIDAGTCITIDYLDAEGRYHGGLISPGIKMQYRALHNETGALPLLEHRRSADYPGQTTEESIHLGVCHGISFLMKGMIDKMKAKEPDIQLILTGGDAGHISELLGEENRIFTAPLLVLTGLDEILRYNS